MSKSKKKTRDVRTLCYGCASDMANAGIKIKRTGGKPGSCDKCHRPGSAWLVE